MSEISSTEEGAHQDKKNNRKLPGALQGVSQGAKLLGQVIVGHEQGKRSFVLPISTPQFFIPPAIFTQSLVFLQANFHWFCPRKY